MKWTTTDGLMINGSQDAGALARRPGLAVVVSEGHQTGCAGELRRESATCLAVGKQYRIKAREVCRNALFFPSGARRRRGIVKPDSQCVRVRDKKYFSRVPVNTNRRLA